MDLYQERNKGFYCLLCKKAVGDLKRAKLHDEDKKHKMRLSYAAEFMKERAKSMSVTSPTTPTDSMYICSPITTTTTTTTTTNDETEGPPPLSASSSCSTMSNKDRVWQDFANSVTTAAKAVTSMQYDWFTSRPSLTPWDAIGIELTDFYSYLAPSDATNLSYELTIARITQVVENAWGRPDDSVLTDVLCARDCNVGNRRWATVIPLGGFVYGLYMPESTIELTLLTNQLSEDCDEEDIINRLMTMVAYKDTCSEILKSRTGWKPCLTATDPRTKLRIQITVNNLDGLFLTAFTREIFWAENIQAPRVMFQVLKYILHSRGLLPTTSKGLDDIPLAFQIFTFFQQHQRFRSCDVNIKNSTRLLGVLLFEFVEIFGKTFCCENFAISYDDQKSGGFTINRKLQSTPELYIKHPFSNENIAKYSSRFEDVKATYLDIHETLSQHKGALGLPVANPENPVATFLLLQKKTIEMRKKLQNIANNVAINSYEFQNKPVNILDLSATMVPIESIRTDWDAKCVQRLRALMTFTFDGISEARSYSIGAYLKAITGR